MVTQTRHSGEAILRTLVDVAQLYYECQDRTMPWRQRYNLPRLRAETHDSAHSINHVSAIDTATRPDIDFQHVIP
jgi:hypothetical protein